MARVLRFVTLALCAGAISAPASASGLGLSVSGNHLVDDSGRPIRLLGVSRSGSEYACAEGYGFFDGPTGGRSIRAMRKWGMNAVRVPLNPDCWLGTDGVKARFAGPAYQAAIDGFVSRLNRAGLYVVIDEHVAAPAGRLAVGIIPMPDADQSPAFWTSVASHFAANRSLVFDLYNE
ncbi:MAG TPA: cellulase family glycosylhydrolase, partial [Solirubrobacterales bacterium]